MADETMQELVALLFAVGGEEPLSAPRPKQSQRATVHGYLGDLATMDVICGSPVRHGAGYTNEWTKVTCRECRNRIDAGYDFITAKISRARAGHGAGSWAVRSLWGQEGGTEWLMR